MTTSDPGLMDEVSREFRAQRDGSGRFFCPWLPLEDQRKGLADFLRWTRERRADPPPPDPAPGRLPVDPAGRGHWAEDPGRDGVLWVGHATFLIRLGGFHLLTDPVWSERASPLSWIGPTRFQPPGLPMDALPRIDGVLISHSHYDHLDQPTVKALARGAARDAAWFVPEGLGDWLRGEGARTVVERTWWESAQIPGPGGRRLSATFTPAQHWAKRGLLDTNRSLWGGWAVRAGRRLFFAGDSGYFPGFREVGRLLGPFHCALVPIGAYEPRWFMEFAHMNPEEAIRVWRDVGGEGLMVPMHWGTFRLTDEDPLEPPRRVREAWEAGGLPPDGLRIPSHGGFVPF